MMGADGGGSGQPAATPYMKPQEFPPPSTTVEVAFGAESRRGRSRTVNEDHFLVLRLGRSQETLLTSLPDEVVGSRFDEYGYAMVVADGMGGTGSGEGASHLAIATLVYLVRHFGKWSLRVDDEIAREIMARVERFYRHVDSTVVHQRRKNAANANQTTLTAAFSAGRDLFFAHVGHSRAYLFRGGLLMRLTRDHTTAGAQQASAPFVRLVDVSAAARDRTHILTDTIGMDGATGPSIDIEHIQLDDHDRVLVCSNGLSDALDEPAMANVLASGQLPAVQCHELIDLAMARGGDDDVTACVAWYRIPQ
jgi:PPM family protein phosphatase